MTGIELYKRLGEPEMKDLTILERLEMDWNYCCGFLVKHGICPRPDELLINLERACIRIIEEKEKIPS